jgi:hypothetical protein
MNVDEALERFGLTPDDQSLKTIKEMLIEETRKESQCQGLGDTELMKLCSIQLFSKGFVEDSLLIWQAKTASMDADCSIDIQLLCGAGLDETKAFLANIHSSSAISALNRIRLCEENGDFEGFSVRDYLDFYRSYYFEE